jgi:adenine-specific DNA-methyltransferase
VTNEEGRRDADEVTVPEPANADQRLEPATIDALRSRIAQLEAEKARWVATRGLCELVWDFRADAGVRAAHERVPLLTEDPGLAIGNGDHPNLLIEGDNYQALLELSYTHASKIDVIYIDPPYSTNSAAIPYDDSFDHSTWLSLMEPRLRLARELLSPDGFLAVSIDDNEMPRLVLLLERIFGSGSTKVVVVKMSDASGVKMAAAYRVGIIPKIKEYLVFAKPGGVKGLQVERIAKGAWHHDRFNQFMTGLTRAARQEIDLRLEAGNPSDEDLSRVEALLADVTLSSVAEAARAAGIDIREQKRYDRWLHDNAWRICGFGWIQGGTLELRDARAQLVPDARWLAVRTTRNLLYILRPTFGLAQLLFADLYLTSHPCDIWTDIGIGRNIAEEGGVTLRNGKKPLQLLRRVVKAHPNKRALVLDFFAGSGTTGQATLELNAEDGGAGDSFWSRTTRRRRTRGTSPRDG